MVEHRFDFATSTLYVKVSGIHKVERMLAAIENRPPVLEGLRSYKILEDATNAQVAFDDKVLEMIAVKLEEKAGSYDCIYHAVVHTDPLCTIYAFLVQKLLNSEKYKLNIFSTFEAAQSWLDEQTI